MISIERLSYLFVAAVMFNAKEAANYTLSISAIARDQEHTIVGGRTSV